MRPWYHWIWLLWLSSRHFSKAFAEKGRPPRIEVDQSSTSLRCRATGVPPPSVRWYADDSEVHLGEELHINQNTNSTYHCIAHNIYGTARSQNIPFQSQKPACTDGNRSRKPEIHVVGPGSAIIIPCDVLICDTPPSISWHHASEPFTKPKKRLRDTPRTYETANGSLYVSHIQGNRTFSCKANHSSKTVLQLGRSHHIVVDHSMPKIIVNTSASEYITVLNGTSMRLDCLHSDSVKWFNGNIEKGDQHVFPVESSFYQTAHDFVILRCETLHKEVIKEIHVTIHNKLSLVQEIEDRLETPADGTAIFTCEAAGTQPQVQWFYNNMLLAGSAIEGLDFSIEKSHTQLKLYNFEAIPKYPSGVVQCNISNDYGSLWQTALFNVTEKTEAATTTSVPIPTSTTASTTVPTTTTYRVSTSKQASTTYETPTPRPQKGDYIVPHYSSPTIRTSTNNAEETYQKITLYAWEIVLIVIVVVVAIVFLAVFIVVIVYCFTKAHNKNLLQQPPTQYVYDPSAYYDPSSRSVVHNHSRGPSQEGSLAPRENDPFLMHQHRAPPSIPHSDSGFAFSDQNSAKQQHIKRYLNDVDNINVGHQRALPRGNSAPSIVSSHGFSAPLNSNNPVFRKVPVGQIPIDVYTVQRQEQYPVFEHNSEPSYYTESEETKL